jgi:tetratricopeptide (TPR) repeat protein
MINNKIISIVLSTFLWVTVSSPQSLNAQGEEGLQLQDFSYWANLCASQKEAKNYEEALEACDQAIALNPNEPQAWIDRGDIQRALNNYAEAAASYGQVIRLEPRHSEAWAKRCAANIQLANYEAAITDCETALQIDETWNQVTRAYALYHQGLALWGQARREKALFSFDLAVQSNPDYSLAWAQRCLLLSQFDQTYDALNSCERALQVNGDWGNRTPAIAWTNRGKILAQLRRYDAALESYDQALAIDPKDATAWTEQGKVLLIIGQPGEALTSQEWALKIRPDYALALANQCATLNQLSQYEDALAACDQAIQEGDGRWGEEGAAYAWSHRADALTGNGRFQEALASANRAVALNPDYADPWSSRGATLWFMGRFEEALGATGQAITINPNSSKAWFNYARILTTLGQYNEAHAAYQRALLGDANVGNILTLAEIWVNLSGLDFRLQRYQEAITAAERAIGINPDSAAAWYNRGLSLMALNQYRNAVETYDRAIAIDAENADFWAGKGIALRFLEQYPQALEALQTALELNPSHPQALVNQEFVMQKLQTPNGMEALPNSGVSKAISFKTQPIKPKKPGSYPGF